VTYTRTKASEGQEHSHSLDEIDQYKINSGVKNAVLEELRKGYSAKEVTKNFVGKGKASIYPGVIVCGGEYLDTAEVGAWRRDLKLPATEADPRRSGKGETWEEELAKAEESCQRLDMRYRLLRVKNQAGKWSNGIVWASDHRLKTLAKRGYITLFDSTHKTNLLQFKLFTWMCRTEVDHKTYLPCAGALLDSESGDTIAAALAQICHWIKDLGLEWRIKYALTDDSAAEQRAVALTFTEESKESLGNVFGEVEHLLCQWHCKQTLNRQLHGDVLTPANRHLQAALWSRRTEAGCDESIQAALDSIPDGTTIKKKNKPWDPKRYIREEWQATKRRWGNYRRMQEQILMQVRTTGGNEGWHNQLKTALGLQKNQNSPFSLAGVLETWEDCARVIDARYKKGLSQWNTKELSVCTEFPWMKQFPFPAQVILNDHLVAAQNRQVEESQITKELTESNECDCKEFWKCLLPCEHMLEAFLYGDAVEPDWDKYSSLFLDQKFDVYEGKRTEVAVDAGADSEGDRSMEKISASSKLDMEETANRIKDRRYAIEDQIRLSGMTLENAERVMRAYNQSLAMAAEKLAGMSINELLQLEASDS